VDKIHEPVGPYVNLDSGKPVEPDANTNGAIVAAPWGACKILGSTQKECSVCGAKVGLSPSSMTLLEKAPQLSIMCMDCLLKEHKES